MVKSNQVPGEPAPRLPVYVEDISYNFEVGIHYQGQATLMKQSLIEVVSRTSVAMALVLSCVIPCGAEDNTLAASTYKTAEPKLVCSFHHQES